MDHRGKVPQIRGNLVHFPGGKWQNGAEINIFEGKVHQMTGKLVHFPCGFPVVPLCRPLVVPCSVWTIGESAADSWKYGSLSRGKMAK